MCTLVHPFSGTFNILSRIAYQKGISYTQRTHDWP